MKKNIVFIFSGLVLLSSCFKEHEKIPPYDRGERITVQIELTQNYKYQVYYGLGQSSVIATNDKKSFDLAFESSENGSHILLNTSNFMLTAASSETLLENVTSADGLNLTYDPSSGNLDSTAIGNWLTINNTDTIYSGLVYIIDRGYDELGNLLGFRKIVFDSLIGDTYYFRYANLDNSNLTVATVTKSMDVNYVYYSFVDHTQLQPEPAADTYDLLFTQYTTLLYTSEGEPYPYLVTGVLLNRFETYVAFDSIHHFDSLTMDIAQNLSFTDQLDRIGYTWKDVVGDVETGQVSYVVNPDWNYIIKAQDGFYYKLRFIGFYNDLGEKGYPTFEYQKL
ncbi:MAG: hypothetical protein HOO86_13640 [Bacteroidales bacterium]|nr:hypothetical protein [Bacteroidales bacterium]